MKWLSWRADRIGDRGLDRRGDRLIVGQADDRIGVIVERQAASIGGFAEQQHGAAVAVLAGDFAQHGHAGNVGGAFAEFGVDRRQHVALVERVEDLRRAHDFEIAEDVLLLRRERRRPAQAEIAQPQPRARQLTVIGGGVLCRRLVEHFGLCLLAHGLGGAALPVAAAGKRVRIFGAFDDVREVLGRGLGIVQEAQRDPAGGEMRIDPIDAPHRRRGFSRDAIGRLCVVLVEQLAHQQAPLLPPLVEIDQRLRTFRRAENQLAGFLGLVVLPQPLDVARKCIRGRSALRRHRIEQRLGVTGLAQDRCARARDRQVIAAKALGGAQASRDVVGIEAVLHANLVVGGVSMPPNISSTRFSTSALASS